LFQAAYPSNAAGNLIITPIWPCSKKGLQYHFCYQKRGELLPPLFTLTLTGGIFSVALSLSSRLPGITWFFFQWSPDFPLDNSSDHRTIYNYKIFIFY